MADPLFKFECGDKVGHLHTKSKGTVVARVEWINGCRRYQVQPDKIKDGVPVDVVSLDEQELKLIKKGNVPKRMVVDVDDENFVDIENLPSVRPAPPPGGPNMKEPRSPTSRR